MDQNTGNQNSGQNPSAADLSALINQLANQTGTTEPATTTQNVQPGVAPVPPVQNPTAAPISAPAPSVPSPVEPEISQYAPQPEPAVAAPTPVSAPAPITPAAAEPVAPVEIAQKNYSITIYTIPTCPFCQAEKDYLKSKGLEYQEKNVEADETALKEMLSLSDNFAGVPVTVLENQKAEKAVVRGFTEKDFSEELGRMQIIQIESALPKENPTPQAPTAPAVEPTVPTPPAPPKIPDLT